jgi:hypothetical protein
VLGLRPFDVQLIGGMILHEGQIAEMRTGEGKTLVAVLPSYLNALAGRGVHVVTVNDYLARRDSEWVGQVPRFLGMKVGDGGVGRGGGRGGGRGAPGSAGRLAATGAAVVLGAGVGGAARLLCRPARRAPVAHHSGRQAQRAACGQAGSTRRPPVHMRAPQVGLIQADLKPEDRRKAYGSDITYVTNSELGFDYLRDNLAGVSGPGHAVEAGGGLVLPGPGVQGLAGAAPGRATLWQLASCCPPPPPSTPPTYLHPPPSPDPTTPPSHTTHHTRATQRPTRTTHTAGPCGAGAARGHALQLLRHRRGGLHPDR